MKRWNQVLAASLALLTAGLSAQEETGWYAWTADPANGPSVIGLEDWLERPAGLRGGVRMAGDRLQLEDGTPIKFWGVNLAGDEVLPDRESADYWAERFARHGINAVRFHKFIGPDALGDEQDSTAYPAERWERFDYFHAALRRRGIYVAWSPIYHHRVRPADAARLTAYEELLQNRRGNSYAITDYAEELQALRLDMLTNLLRHRNPHTGLTYAEDPALAMIELQNEASIFFWSEEVLQSMPTYQERLNQRFSDWLAARYGSHEKLLEVWGPGALDAFGSQGEHLDRRNLRPWTRSQDFGPTALSVLAERGLGPRLGDTMRFLYEVQDGYYQAFVRRMREAGYEGPLIGSCWRGQKSFGEYYNLLADARVGLIDRHNYHGGLSGWKPRPEAFGAASQLGRPGAGLLSSGFYQVRDRPFSFSEWASVFPNEWALESPALVALYGLGLQGWDASFQFAARTKGRGYSEALHVGNLLWNVERPDQLGLYPLWARMILRGDLREGPVVSVRRVSEAHLAAGRLPFGEETWKGGWDVKQYAGPVPVENLARGRVLVEFSDAPPDLGKTSSPPEASPAVPAATGQLRWQPLPEGRGYVVIDTPWTQGLVGFLPAETFRLGQVAITPQAGFAAVVVTSRDRVQTLAEARESLVFVMARNRNTGMRFTAAGSELTELGGGPVRLEPVEARVQWPGRPLRHAEVLDQAGRSTGQPARWQADTLTVDGRTDRSPYYLVTLE